MRSKTAFSILSLIAAAAVAWSCSTTRSLEDGQYRLAKNKVVINGDKKLSPREIDKYIQQKSNSYIVFGWNPFLNLYPQCPTSAGTWSIWAIMGPMWKAR